MTYLHSIRQHPQSIQEALISEAPHTKINAAPPGLEYLTQGIVDFGFENLGLPEAEFKRVMLGFSGQGVMLTGHDMIVRAVGTFGAVIERPGRAKYPLLPENWEEAVLVIDTESGEIIHAGSLVRADQTGA